MTLVMSDCFDLNDLLERLDGDVELAEEMVQLYLEELPRLMMELEKYVAQENWSQVSLVAHGLKGASANIGAVYIQALSFEIESAAKQEQALLIPECYQKLKHEYQRFHQKVLC